MIYLLESVVLSWRNQRQNNDFPAWAPWLVNTVVTSGDTIQLLTGISVTFIIWRRCPGQSVLPWSWYSVEGKTNYERYTGTELEYNDSRHSFCLSNSVYWTEKFLKTSKIWHNFLSALQLILSRKVITHCMKGRKRFPSPWAAALRQRLGNWLKHVFYKTKASVPDSDTHRYVTYRH